MASQEGFLHLTGAGFKNAQATGPGANKNLLLFIDMAESVGQGR
jgi:hypothetical protein